MYHITRKASFSWIVPSCIVCGFILQFLVAVDLACASSHTTGLVNHQLEQEGCFIILIGKDRTTDGSVLVAHNEDGSNKSTRLAYVPRQHHSEKEMHLNYVTIPQVPETLAYWVMGNSEAVASEYDNEWILNGMNEAGVCVTCAVTSTREAAPPEKQGLTRFAIRQLILERATSARDAVDLFSHLISEYGLALSPGIPHQTIACGLADSEEAWLIESSFRHWVAKRVPDDSYSASGNIYTIDTDWDLSSPDLVEYATDQGWYDPEQGPFSFKDAYTSREALHSAHSTSRVWQAQVMLNESKERKSKVDVSFLWSIISQPPVQTDSTQAFMIWHLRDELPKELGTLMWHGLGNATTSVMVPIYMGSTEVPAPYMDSPEDYDTYSAYWQFRLIGTTLYPQRWIYAAPYKEVRRKLDRLQRGIKRRNMWVEWFAPMYYKFYGVEALKKVLTTHTYDELQTALDTADKIVETLQFEPSAR